MELVAPVQRAAGIGVLEEKLRRMVIEQVFEKNEGFGVVVFVHQCQGVFEGIAFALPPFADVHDLGGASQGNHEEQQQQAQRKHRGYWSQR